MPLGMVGEEMRGKRPGGENGAPEVRGTDPSKERGPRRGEM